VGDVLRVALTGPVPEAVGRVGDAWRDRAGDDVDVRTAAWPVDADVVARHQLVVGIAADRPPPATDAVDEWVDLAGADALWHDRIAPFAANLAAGRRAPRRRVAVLVGPDPTWPAQARRVIARVHHALGDRAERIDHIGSTSVPGLPAKQIVDVQVVVADLGAAAAAAMRAHDAGLVDVGEWDAPDRSGARHAERVLVDADPGRPTTVNLRPVTDPVWRETLLFRDWLRADPAHRDGYLAEKQRLAAGAGHVDAYGDGKLGWVGAALGRAEAWAAATGWTP
jgi:dephospho-CoA kinase